MRTAVIPKNRGLLFASAIDSIVAVMSRGAEEVVMEMDIEMIEHTADDAKWKRVFGFFGAVAEAEEVERRRAAGEDVPDPEPAEEEPDMMEVADTLLPVMWERQNDAVQSVYDNDYKKFRGRVKRLETVELELEREDPLMDPKVGGGSPSNPASKPEYLS